jgi:hypothetical protein
MIMIWWWFWSYQIINLRSYEPEFWIWWQPSSSQTTSTIQTQAWTQAAWIIIKLGMGEAGQGVKVRLSHSPLYWTWRKQKWYSLVTLVSQSSWQWNRLRHWQCMAAWQDINSNSTIMVTWVIVSNLSHCNFKFKSDGQSEGISVTSLRYKLNFKFIIYWQVSNSSISGGGGGLPGQCPPAGHHWHWQWLHLEGWVMLYNTPPCYITGCYVAFMLYNTFFMLYNIHGCVI